MRRLLVSLVAILGCAGVSKKPADACRGDGEFFENQQLARYEGCREILGSIVIQGSAIDDLSPLGSVRRLRGDLVLGPSYALKAAPHLGRLQHIEGSLRVIKNRTLEGLYLGSLVRVDGDVVVEDNFALRTVSLHALRTLKGEVVIRNNRSLSRVDLSVLDPPNLVLDKNPELTDIVHP
jgi:hypothetical protein